MSLSSLPSELVSLIAESLPRADQARLSLASNQVRSSVQPVLYRNVQFDVDTFHDAELELFEDGCRRLGQAVESLADDPARCRFIRRFASKDHQAWLDREDLAQCVVRILLQATRVEQVDFVRHCLLCVSGPQLSAHQLAPRPFKQLQTDDEWVTQLDWSPYYYIEPVWRVLPRLPSLRRLTNEVGPVDVLHLESLENLVELDMRTHIIDERAEGTLPASLEVLHLADVRNMTNGWFRPSLFSHLRSLSLFNIDDNAVEVIWNAVVVRSSALRPVSTGLTARHAPRRTPRRLVRRPSNASGSTSTLWTTMSRIPWTGSTTATQWKPSVPSSCGPCGPSNRSPRPSRTSKSSRRPSRTGGPTPPA